MAAAAHLAELAGIVEPGRMVLEALREGDGQAPAGLLKEKRRGSGSGMLYPQTGHAKEAENNSSSRRGSM